MRKTSLFYGLILCLSILLPVRSYAVSPGASLDMYVIPGIFGQDYATGWIAHSHIRFVQYDKAFDPSGHEVDAGVDVTATQIIEKIGHIQRFGKDDKWQLSNVLVVPVVNMHAKIKNGPDMSASGLGDLLLANFLGTWWNDHKYHAGLCLGVSMPMGTYNNDNNLNVGSNRWVLYFPTAVGHFRFPLPKGLFMVDAFIQPEWRFKNPDNDFKDHDCLEMGATLTYFPSDDRKLGLFVTPNYQFALNESELNGKGMGDSDFYSLGGSVGATYNINTKENLSLRWTHNFDGKGNDGGSPSPKIDAIHFVWSHVF
ncbi:MAG: transporter [Geobacter sp.]|nr:MAG: transporter [Geobacter sp.]